MRLALLALGFMTLVQARAADQAMDEVFAHHQQ
jgi:hypothetical protein